MKSLVQISEDRHNSSPFKMNSDSREQRKEL